MSLLAHPLESDLLPPPGFGPSQWYGALPPNQGMQLTVKSVTPFAYAKAAPLSPAADARC
jgi:hypothetical protein